MKRSVAIFFLVAAVLATSFIGQAQEKPTAPEKPLVVEPVKKPAVRPAGPILRRDLTLRKARDLGLTVASIRTATNELKDAGDIDADTSRAEAAVLIAGHLKGVNADAYGSLEDLDWDSIFAFIEKILSLFNLI